MQIMYHKPIVCDDGSVLSCDNVRINFTVLKSCRDDFERLFANVARVDIKSFPINLNDFKFKYLWQITYPVDDGFPTMTVGYILNGSNHAVDITRGYLDFNPNKVGSNGLFWADLAYIRKCSEDWSIARVDVALDIPSKRDFVFLLKDNRKYALDAYSLSNRTEYLGRRSNVGFVKVYNKTIESKLTEDITRIEVTCEPFAASYLAHFPKVYDLGRVHQFDADILSLNDTDLAILRLALGSITQGGDPGLMIFNSLGRKKKEKLEPFILPESSLVLVASLAVSNLFESINALYG